LLDKKYFFAIPMTYQTYNEETRSNVVHVTQNQYINYNRLDYVLQRYNDWIRYRTFQFAKD